MNEQADKANKFARDNFGGEVDAAAGAAGLKVHSPGDDKGPGERPWVELPGMGNRDIADFARDMGAACAETPIFRRGEAGSAVLVTVDARTGDMKVMDTKRFMSWISDHVVVFEECTVGRGEKQAKMRFRKTMPKTTAECCLAADQFQERIRPLVRVNSVRAPWASPDGKVVLLPEGYHAASQIFTVPSGVKIDETCPLEKALRFLGEVYGEFGFTEPRSLSVAIALPIALWGHALVSDEVQRPGFIVRANTQGGGKSLIAQIGITVAYGLPSSTPKTKDDELKKVLDSAVFENVPYLFFDNQKGHFENILIESFMTSSSWRARVMGTQKMMQGKVSQTFIITGNNLTVSPDMQRRLLQCDLFVEEFDLQEKDHKRELNPRVLNEPRFRGEFLSALWALVQHWDQAGRPKAGAAARPYRLATFADWSDVFGGIVQAAGYGNPLERPKDDQSASPMSQHQRKLIERLAAPAEDTIVDEHTPMLEYDFQALVDYCHENEWFSWKMKGKERENEGGKKWFELLPESNSSMGLIFTKEMAGTEKKKRFFTMPDGRRIAFYKIGEGRSKRYVVQFAGRVGPPAPQEGAK